MANRAVLSKCSAALLAALLSFFVLSRLTLAVVSPDQTMPWIHPMYLGGDKRQSVCTPIRRIPFVIHSEGKYCVSNPLRVENATGSGIVVLADNVELDLKGMAVIGPSTRNATGAGIAAAGVKNLRISNGRIRGFLYGVRIDKTSPTTGMSAEQILVERLDIRGSRFRGIFVEAEGVDIIQSQVKDVGGTTLFAEASTAGIEVLTSRCKIEGNRIMNVMPVSIGESAAIRFAGGTSGCVIAANELSNDKLPEYGRSFGFMVVGSLKSPGWITANKVEGFLYPYRYVAGGRLEMRDNRFIANYCTPHTFPAYFKRFGGHEENTFVEDDRACADTAAHLSHKAASGDPHWLFRFSQAELELIGLDPEAETRDRLISLVTAMQSAADRGIEEAQRRLPNLKALRCRHNQPCLSSHLTGESKNGDSATKDAKRE